MRLDAEAKAVHARLFDSPLQLLDAAGKRFIVGLSLKSHSG